MKIKKAYCKYTRHSSHLHMLQDCWIFFFCLVRWNILCYFVFSIWPLKCIPGGDTTWERCWYHVHRVLKAQPNPFRFQKLDKAFQLLIWLHSHDRCPEKKKKRVAQLYRNSKCKCKFKIQTKPSSITFSWEPFFYLKKVRSHLSFINKLIHTLTFSALLSISDVHFLMIKGMPSGTFLAAWANSTPNKWSLPWSFLCPHWIAKVSKHFLWHASEH